MSRKALFDLLSEMGQSAARVRPFIDSLDDAAAARLLAAAEAGDGRAVMRAMADQTWGTAPARAVPEAPAPTGSRSPIPFEQRVVNDPEIRRTIEAAGVPPALRAGVDAGDLQAILESYRNAANAEDSIRTLRRPPDQVAAENIAGQFDRALGGDVPTRQMELPLADEPTAAVPFGVRGPGVAVGKPYNDPLPPVAIDAPMLSQLDEIGPRRLPSASTATPINVADDANLQDFIGQPMRGDDYIPDEPVVRASRPAPAQSNNRFAKGAAAAAGLGAAAYWASQNRPDVERKADASAPVDDESPAVESGGEADLAEETSPPPAVEATAEKPEPTVAQAPQDASLQARALINRLNDMRRAAGGEVPEAPAMMKEINRLLAIGNQTRRATMVAAPQDDAGRLYQQAQALIDKVNQMYRQGMTPNSPQVQRVMAQVRQLQSQGDAMRNRRAG